MVKSQNHQLSRPQEPQLPAARQVPLIQSQKILHQVQEEVVVEEAAEIPEVEQAELEEKDRQTIQHQLLLLVIPLLRIKQ